MNFASDKNFPKFVHNDTIIKSSASDENNASFFLLSKYLKKYKSPKKTQKTLNNNSNSLNFPQISENPNLSYSLAYNNKRSEPEKPSKTLINVKKFPKIMINDANQFQQSFDIKSQHFMRNMLYNTKKNSEIDKQDDFLKNLFKKYKNRKKNAIKNNKEQLSIPPASIISDHKRQSIKYKFSQQFSFPMFSSILDQNANNFKKTRKFTHIISIQDLTASRGKSIPHYKELRQVILNLEKNLTDYLNSVGYNERSAKILASLLSKKIDMENLFFYENERKIIEPISNFYLEEQCLIREKVLDINGKLVSKVHIDPLMISELVILNDKLEEMNNKKYIEDLKIIKDSLLMEYGKMKELESDRLWNMKLKNMDRIVKLNCEIMPNILLMKEMDEFERQYGECNLIDKKNKMISRTIEDMLGDIKKTTIDNSPRGKK